MRSNRTAHLQDLLRTCLSSLPDTGDARHIGDVGRRMLALLEEEGDPFDRSRTCPGHFTASALVLDGAARSALLVWHQGLGRWLQPGGHVEVTDQDLEATALREVEEETGIQASSLAGPLTVLDLDIHTIPASPRLSMHQHFDVRFLARLGQPVATGDAPLPVPGTESPTAWFPARPDRLPPTDDSLRRALQRALFTRGIAGSP